MKYGLIGYPLSHSFSQRYFSEKFEREGLSHEYVNFQLEDIEQLPAVLRQNPDLMGFNVTIPYKQQVIPYLYGIDVDAKEIGAVNTVRVIREGGETRLYGYNSDVYGFRVSLENSLRENGLRKPAKALVLGTGGAALAVLWALRQVHITVHFVSRSRNATVFKTYSELTNCDIARHHLIVNTTPLGMFPNALTCPDIPFAAVGSRHLLFDLVYNPPLTRFLENGLRKGAAIRNGEQMLYGQADKSWQIWNLPKENLPLPINLSKS